MVTLKLTDDQVADIVNQLPPNRRRAVLIRLAREAAARRDERMLAVEERLRQVAASRGLDWEALSDAEREALVDDLVHEDR